MESLNIKTYLIYAIYIVRTNPKILLFVAILGLVSTIGTHLPGSSSSNLGDKIAFARALFINPVIYGIYFGIIEERHNSVIKIFSTYVAGYLILLFFMYIPIVTVIAALMPSPDFNGNIGMVMITILIFSLLYLYVIPAYFITRTLIGSIITGVRFLLNNLLNSAPVLLVALFTELLLLFSQYNLVWLKEMNLFFYGILEFSIYMFSNIIDFLLFIVLVYILKRNGLAEKEPL